MRTTGRLALVSLLFLVACGGGGDGPPPLGEAGDPANADRTIEVSADEFRFSLDEIEVDRDETIEFVVGNDGQTAHEFSIGGGHEDSGGHDHVHGPASGSTGAIPPGETTSLVWHFTEAGETVFACYIENHDKQGMTGTLTVGE
ncbi:MAG: cupredoxin domain-containing protein [Actinomycetota bacterium]|nr:cupredoxin domain-containing protein [Actinomycetota bacterium]